MTYIEAIANAIRAEVPRSDLPKEPTDDLFVTYAMLLLAKGNRTEPADVHNAWVAWMVNRGERHPAMVPFDQLDIEVQRQDGPFLTAILRVAQRMAAGHS
jgi:hypothetical protein